MNNTPDRCNQLRKLHEQLTSQVKTLRGNMQQAERDGVANPIESANTLKTLQASLNRVVQQLEGCPPENVEAGSTQPEALQQQAKEIRSRQWFPETTEDNSDVQEMLGASE